MQIGSTDSHSRWLTKDRNQGFSDVEPQAAQDNDPERREANAVYPVVAPACSTGRARGAPNGGDRSRDCRVAEALKSEDREPERE